MKKAKRPRAAPTAMKTVPSGSVDFFIYGAFAVGGTEGAGYLKPPGKVGSPEGSPPTSVSVLSRGGGDPDVAAAVVAVAEAELMPGKAELSDESPEVAAAEVASVVEAFAVSAAVVAAGPVASGMALLVVPVSVGRSCAEVEERRSATARRQRRDIEVLCRGSRIVKGRRASTGGQSAKDVDSLSTHQTRTVSSSQFCVDVEGFSAVFRVGLQTRSDIQLQCRCCVAC